MGVGCLGAGGARRTGAGRRDVRGKKPGETKIVARFRVTTSPRSDLGSAGDLPISPRAWKFTNPAVTGCERGRVAQILFDHPTSLLSAEVPTVACRNPSPARGRRPARLELGRCHSVHAGELPTDPSEVVGQIVDDASRRWRCVSPSSRPGRPNLRQPVRLSRCPPQVTGGQDVAPHVARRGLCRPCGDQRG
jgi:hypothetical protein